MQSYSTNLSTKLVLLATSPINCSLAVVAFPLLVHTLLKVSTFSFNQVKQTQMLICSWYQIGHKHTQTVYGRSSVNTGKAFRELSWHWYVYISLFKFTVINGSILQHWEQEQKLKVKAKHAATKIFAQTAQSAQPFALHTTLSIFHFNLFLLCNTFL